MNFPDVVTREQWLAARKRMLDLEKQATRARDALNAERRRLPMVRVDKEYVLEGPDGTKTLAGLFGDSRQLIVRHVMFGPDWDAACPGCTAAINEMSDGLMTHLRSRDTAFMLVSRASLAKLEKYRAEQGWTYPWYSSFDTYSTWARGTESLVVTYSLLDLTALGRQEDWEEPKDRAPRLHGADPTFRS